jgi:hypothetical protein
MSGGIFGVWFRVSWCVCCAVEVGDVPEAGAGVALAENDGCGDGVCDGDGGGDGVVDGDGDGEPESDGEGDGDDVSEGEGVGEVWAMAAGAMNSRGKRSAVARMVFRGASIDLETPLFVASSSRQPPGAAQPAHPAHRAEREHTGASEDGPSPVLPRSGT